MNRPFPPARTHEPLDSHISRIATMRGIARRLALAGAVLAIALAAVGCGKKSITGPEESQPDNQVIRSFTATPGDGQVTLTWQKRADAELVPVVIVRKEEAAPTSESDGVEVYRGIDSRVVDSQLENGVTYHYGAFAQLGGSLKSTSTAQATPKATPKPEPKPEPKPAPPNVGDFRATGGLGQIDLSWSLPQIKDLAGVIVVRKEGLSVSTSPKDGTLVFQGLAKSFSDRPPLALAPFTYTAFTVTSDRRISAGVSATAKTVRTLPPPTK